MHTFCNYNFIRWALDCVMKVKDQVSFYDAIRVMEIGSLEKIRKILLTKKRTDNNIDKLNLVDVAIEEKHRRKEYMSKL